jgi:hypothetical protein
LGAGGGTTEGHPVPWQRDDYDFSEYHPKLDKTNTGGIIVRIMNLNKLFQPNFLVRRKAVARLYGMDIDSTD